MSDDISFPNFLVCLGIVNRHQNEPVDGKVICVCSDRNSNAAI
jgi:hypothetical protein